MHGTVLTSPAHFALITALALTTLWTGCARTALEPPCPLGFTQDGNACICLTDQGCPVGHACEEGVCICREDACCPAGYQYSEASATCVCRDSQCCPADHVWIADQQKCTCGDQDCCPEGYVFQEELQACQCASDECCPKGFAFDPTAQICVCDSDECCPADYRFDESRKDCVCAKDACCPPEHKYNENVKACVCVGDSCCPAGFEKDPAGDRCVCISDASCGPNQFCDRMGSGACRCVNNQGCQAGQYCNTFGFCQSIAACTSNADCPPSMFCDVSRDACVPAGPCTLDAHCPFGQICDAASASCRNGCRRDSDCPQKDACINGLCLDFCRDNNSCGVDQFCSESSGACFFESGRWDCRRCETNLDCPLIRGGENAPCLGFISEGQNEVRFCGMPCTDNGDCPSGYDCTGVIHVCNGDSDCASADGVRPTCEGFLVENESGTQFYCAGPSGEPHAYSKSCAPSSGFCPASSPP
ncbi:MAG: hypothetical protein WBV82_25015 [Myxococcaceae bacterium]